MPAGGRMRHSAILPELDGYPPTAFPEYGTDIAIDASDLPAYANGQRFLSKNGPERERYSDPDASWGHRSAVSTRKGGGFHGYRVHAAVCTKTDLPLAWEVATAASHESNYVAGLLDTAKARGFDPETVELDKGYDVERVYGECEDRDCRPIIPLRETPAVKAGKAEPPECEHGEWRFAGSDSKRKASKWPLPDRRVRARERMDQGRPPPSARAARDAALAQALPWPRRR